MGKPQTEDFIAGKVLSGRVYPEFFPFKSTDYVLNVGAGYAPQAIAYQANYAHMVGLDITFDRLQKSLAMRSTGDLGVYDPICANVEQLPLAAAQFDKAIAIDIIEHVQQPRQLCAEIARVLKPEGEVLITFPTMHDKYTAAISWVARHILRRKSQGTFHDKREEWHPDAHNQAFPVADWIALVESCGFQAQAQQATTLFPPLHLYGVPRFWFSNNLIHRIDAFFARQPVLKNYGQGLMVIFKRIPDVT